MAQDQMSSLFGTTPEALQAQRDAALQQQAMQYAKMDPFQRSTAAIYSGASRLGTGVAGMMGAQDPEMMRTTQRQALFAKERPSDAAGWKRLAQALNAGGDASGAQEALAKAASMEAAALAGRKTEADISWTEQQRLASVATVEGNAVKGMDRKGIAAALKSKFPDLDEAALLGLAGNDKLVADLFKPENANKEFIIATTAGGVYMVNKANPNERVHIGDPKGSEMAALMGQIAAARLESTQASADLARERLVALKDKKIGDWRAGVSHVNQGLAQASLMKKNVSLAMGLAPTSWVGSGIQSMLSKLPGSSQKSLENIVATLKSNEGLGKLQEMKAASPTGGSGLGAVSGKELAFLTDNIAVLDPSDPRFKEQLTDILNHWQAFEDSLKEDALYLKTKTPEDIKKERAEREADQAKGADKKPTGAGTASDPIVLTPRKKG